MTYLFIYFKKVYHNNLQLKPNKCYSFIVAAGVPFPGATQKAATSTGGFMRKDNDLLKMLDEDSNNEDLPGYFWIFIVVIIALYAISL